MSLPDLGVDWIKAKIDTGARTSALHAFEIVEFERDGDAWVRFKIKPWQDSQEDARVVECPIHDRRVVRSSSGHKQNRYVITLRLKMVGREVNAEVTLTNRDKMGFRMLIGREALKRGYVVDPARSFLGGRAPGATRRRNRGKA